MKNASRNSKKPNNSKIIDNDFKPAILENEKFMKQVSESGNSIPLIISIERNNGYISTYKTDVFRNISKELHEYNCFYIERLVKTLLWSRGGWKIMIGGSPEIASHIKKIYSVGGGKRF